VAGGSGGPVAFCHDFGFVFPARGNGFSSRAVSVGADAALVSGDELGEHAKRRECIGSFGDVLGVSRLLELSSRSLLFNILVGLEFEVPRWGKVRLMNKEN
jgi:hypothetical protein